MPDLINRLNAFVRKAFTNFDENTMDTPACEYFIHHLERRMFVIPYDTLVSRHKTAMEIQYSRLIELYFHNCTSN